MYNNDSDSLNAGAPDIRLTGNQQMASAPDPMAEMNDFSMQVFGKSLHQLTPPQLDALYELMNEQSKAPQQNLGIMASAPKGTYTQNRKQMMMAAGGRIGYKEGYSVQGGVKNYLGDQEMVSNVPVKWQSGPDKPQTELAYITDAEKNLLLKEDIHGSLKNGPNEGPGGLMSLDSWGDRSGGQAGSDVSRDTDRGGGGGGSPATTYSYSPPVTTAQSSNAQAVVDEAVKQAEALNIANTDLVSPIADNRSAVTGLLPMSQLISPADDDIDALYSASGADFTPTDTRTIGDKVTDFYKTYSVPGMITNYLKEPVNPYQGITGEDALGGGDFQYTDVRDFSQGELNTDYESLDQEGQGLVDQAFSDSGGLSDSARDIGLPSSQMETVYGGPTTTAPTTTTPTPTSTTTEDEIMTLAEADTGLTDAEKTEAFQTSVANQMAANAAAKKNTPFENYYVGGDPTAAQTAFMRASGAAPSTVGLEQYAAQGGRIGYDQGGIAGLRQPYFLGKAVKKITGAAKKVLKSPIGKAALLGAGIFGVPGTQFTGLMGSKFLTGALAKGTHHADPGWLKAALGKVMTKKGLGTAATLATLSPFLMKQEEDEEDELTAMYRGKGIDIPGIRKAVGQRGLKREDYPFMPSSYYAAEGGRIGLAEGLSPRTAALQAMYGLNEEEDNKKLFAAQKKAQGGRIGFDAGGNYEAKIKELMDKGMSRQIAEAIVMSQGSTIYDVLDVDKKAQGGRIGYRDGSGHKTSGSELRPEKYVYIQKSRTPPGKKPSVIKKINPEYTEWKNKKAEGGRIGAEEGGLMNLGGMEKDYRQEGGFVPIGGKEKADDVPARLSKNEFVFTADAVRNAGGGDIDKGAEIMENLMNSLESGGEVSKESQGLEGARGMFANAQQLQKRII